MAVIQGQPGAFGKLLELAKAEHASFNTNKVGLNDSQLGDLSRQTFAPLHDAFKVIAEAPTGGNSVAVDAVVRSMSTPTSKFELSFGPASWFLMIHVQYESPA